MCNIKEQTITISSHNLVLTPFTYTTILGEILKCLIYEKSQIPYPYNYLDNLVMRKRKRLSEDENYKSTNITGNRQFLLATKALDCVKEVVNCLKTIFTCNNSSNIKEVIFLFGANTFMGKEMYSFVIPEFASGHAERNHYLLTSKYQHDVLRSIFMSKEWLSRMETPLTPTNFHFMLRLSESKTIVLDERTFDLFSTNTNVSVRNTPNLKINIAYDTSVKHNCCSNLEIYEDRSNENEENSDLKVTDAPSSSNNIYNDSSQSSSRRPITIDSEYIVFKSIWCGFKEKFINKIPALEIY